MSDELNEAFAIVIDAMAQHPEGRVLLAKLNAELHEIDRHYDSIIGAETPR